VVQQAGPCIPWSGLGKHIPGSFPDLYGTVVEISDPSKTQENHEHPRNLREFRAALNPRRIRSPQNPGRNMNAPQENCEPSETQGETKNSLSPDGSALTPGETMMPSEPQGKP
jgi:hypothetical protein